jgi:hypothetical protein
MHSWSGYSITYANDGNTPSVGYTVHAESPCSQNRCGKQDGELPLLCHFVDLYVTLYLASRHAQTFCQ